MEFCPSLAILRHDQSWPERDSSEILAGYDIGSVQERTGACKASVSLYNFWIKQVQQMKPVFRRCTDRYHRQGHYYFVREKDASHL